MQYTGRRDFMKGFAAAAALAAAGCACPCCSGEKRRYALQLYSIHKIFWSDPEMVLLALKAGGYDGVEFYNYNGKSARELRTMCGDAGLKAMGTHINGDVYLVGDELKKTLDFAAEAGFESIVTPHAKRDSEDGYRKFGYAMGLAAEAADSYGIKVGIHTTYHHFRTVYGGTTAWDVIYSEASPKLYQQVDTANTFHTGYDVVGLLAKYEGRHFSVHMKENVPTVDGVLGVPPKDGGKCVPWKEVVSTLKADDSLRWWIVEAEGRTDSVNPPLKCIDVLKKWTA
jgi:sugar phosphate isomerase/epimerase